MRAIVAAPGPRFAVMDVFEGWVAGLTEAGVDVAPYRLDHRLDVFESSLHWKGGTLEKTFPRSQDAAWLAAELLRCAAFDWWPDLVIVVSGFFVPPETVTRLRARNMRTVLLATESPYQDDQQLRWAEAYDCVVLNDPTHLDKFAQVADTVYIPHAHDPAKHHPGPPTPGLVSDFAWCGTAYPSRRAFFHQVDWSGLTVRLAGNWADLPPLDPLAQYVQHPLEHCCPNDETVALYRSTATSCNLYRARGDAPGESNGTEFAQGWAMGPREIELAACGTWFARDPRPEGDEVLGMFPTFTSPAQMIDQVRWAVVHPEAREQASVAAMAAVADRTFVNNAKLLLTHLGF